MLPNEDIFDIKNNIISSVSSTKLNKIEINIKQKLNDMKIEIEKNNKKLRPSKLMSISPDKINILKLKLSYLKKLNKKKRKSSRKSVLIEDAYFESQVEGGINKERSKSFCIPENKKNKILNRINKKINKESNNKLDVIGENKKVVFLQMMIQIKMRILKDIHFLLIVILFLFLI